jgi:sugar/nucleoside kinase (ribokinase family)
VEDKQNETDIEILCVGDTVTDAFIRLFDEYGHTYYNEKGAWLALPFGTKMPFERVEVVPAVGNAANAAVSFARLGFKSALMANIGDDRHGREILRALQKNKVDTEFVRIQHNKISNYHYVLWYKEDRTILIKHEQYKYYWPHLRRDEIPRWIYFSSISEHALDFHDDLADWLDDHPDTKLAFQPGTFQMKAGTARLKRIYARSEVLLLNREEAAGVSKGNHNSLDDLFDRLHALGPKIVVITDGPHGAYASGPEGRFKMPNYPDPKPPFERTGAGDAFSSAFVAALAKGSNIEGALQWAPINAMSVVQKVGAQAGLLEEKDIARLLEKAPEWYKPQKL